MKKGKIFTNCLFSIWTLSVILSFASCSSDGDSISIIDESVSKTDYYTISNFRW